MLPNLTAHGSDVLCLASLALDPHPVAAYLCVARDDKDVACAGWWCFIDALVVTKAVQHEGFPFTYWLPGIVATVALVRDTERPSWTWCLYCTVVRS